MFWNLENFFDWRRDSLLSNPSQQEFSSKGKRRWTRSKFNTKSQAIAKTIFWIGGQRGRLPDIIGVAEVENSFVLKRLISETPLRKAGFRFIHFDSPDPRGIDVALLYRQETLRPLCSKPLGVSGKDFKTRDILLAGFETAAGDSIAFLVNHHPSKYGGSSSSGRRKAAMDCLMEATDSLKESGWRHIVAMGDFNDTPPSASEYSKKTVNLAIPLWERGEGTIKYAGKWEMIDMFFVSKDLWEDKGPLRMWIERVPFLTVRDNTHFGEKPFRSYTGPRYTGGVSDHRPISLMIP